jgi:hypothetical protein
MLALGSKSTEKRRVLSGMGSQFCADSVEEVVGDRGIGID